ncbi:flagellar L-ring protein 1 [Gluconacetobacter liquefaciens]|uniref:Flagellar L-ring protein n=2 Tax=Gluconacetobacter liquefaciens TaxID=89584 RepID=A0A7W4JJB0_GLULI|nr:flagellar basal body L-ring protein FlgH [Gluconacetobacter liquefaciens]MBB2185770.1 flagellar basal body L-ring protein FlgH [Gluconacetobacter liquefaciens]GEB36217.1 flagellar L-ring protein 1 [Gluconacetobacter liquefaciens]
MRWSLPVMKHPQSGAILAGLLCLSGCTGLADMSEIGHPPRMTTTSDPTQAPDYRPITMPMPPLQPPPTEVGSLWRPGSRAFFKDQRASQVGDLITIDVNIADNAAVRNNTSAAGSGSQTFGIPSFFGAQGKTLSSSSALDTSSASANTGTGTITRNETVTLALAGTITQVLPNGNFVVVARQEVRVNGELRQLMVSGVVRPQDITEDNIVTHDRIAEARISYGGRGQLSRIQTPRYGQQIMDSVLPF